MPKFTLPDGFMEFVRTARAEKAQGLAKMAMVCGDMEGAMLWQLVAAVSLDDRRGEILEALCKFGESRSKAMLRGDLDHEAEAALQELKSLIS